MLKYNSMTCKTKVVVRKHKHFTTTKTRKTMCVGNFVNVSEGCAAWVGGVHSRESTGLPISSIHKVVRFWSIGVLTSWPRVVMTSSRVVSLCSPKEQPHGTERGGISAAILWCASFLEVVRHLLLPH